MNYDPSGPGLFPDSYIEESTRPCDSGEEAAGAHAWRNPFRNFGGLTHLAGRQCHIRDATAGTTVGSGTETWVTCPECKEER